jgi:hypothetical protein
MNLIYRILAIFVRIIISLSPIGKELSKYFIFDSLIYSYNHLKENSLNLRIFGQTNKFFGIENYFSVIFF